MRRFFALLLTPLLLAACVEPPAPSEGADACGAPDLQYLVGQPGRVLDGMRFSQEVRVIQPGSAVTMDYQPGRLNILLDAADVIEQVSCG